MRTKVSNFLKKWSTFYVFLLPLSFANNLFAYLKLMEYMDLKCENCGINVLTCKDTAGQILYMRDSTFKACFTLFCNLIFVSSLTFIHIVFL